MKNQPQKYSPNWYWRQLGFSVQRNKWLRTIVDSNNNQVLINAGYLTELAVSRWLYHGAISTQRS